MVFNAKLPSVEKIINDLTECKGNIGNYFGFPLTNLEHLYNEKKTVEH